MRRLGPVVLAGLVSFTASSCSGGDDTGSAADSVPVNESLCLDSDRAEEPVVGLIDPAIATVEQLYGSPQRYFEVSADRQRVSLVVAVDDGTAEQVFFCGAGGRTPPESLGDADGATFPADAIEIDPDSIFDQLDEELDEPEIVDFAIVGAGGDDVVQDATVQSDSGGVLLVLLAADGEVLAVQAQ